MYKRGLILFFLFSFLASLATAVELPRSMRTGDSSFMFHVLGPSCYAFDLDSDNLPCNPAFLANPREGKFRGNLFVGNNITYTQEAKKLLDGNADQQTVERLFQQRQSSELELNLEGAYQTENFGIAYAPIKLSYYTLFQNRALPQITLYAAQDEQLKGQLGAAIDRNFSWGLQGRLLKRRFISQQFFVTDALAANGNSLFEPKEQKLFYLEPSLLWQGDSRQWTPSASFNLTNLGVADREYEEAPRLPQYHFASALENTWDSFTWGLGFDYFWDREVQKILEPLTLGSYFRYGILKVLGSLGETRQGLGFDVVSGCFEIGMGAEWQTLEDALGEKTRFQKLYLLLGVEI